MQSFSRGFDFLKQSWQMVAADRDLIKPSIYAMLVGFVVTIIGGIPIALVFVVFGDSTMGQVIGGILSAVLIFIQYTVA